MNNKIEEIIRDEEAVWEQRKLGDILISLQNNTLSRADLSNEAGVAKNVHYGDVLIKFGEVLDVSKEKLPMISDESVLSKYKSSFLQNGDVIVADTAEDSTVGKCSEIAGLNDEVVLSGLHTIPYRPIEKFASGYLGYYLNSSAYHNQLIPLMQGIKVASISKSAMQDTDIVYPKSVKEQGKIGDYFQSLDHLITLHQRISLYFLKINTFVWEQRKLIDFVDVLDGDRGKNYPTSDDFDISGHTLFLNASNVTNDGFLFQDNQFITEEKSNSMGNGKLEEDDIVVTSRGSLGHIAWYNADISSFVPYARINSGMLILRNKKEVETEYLYHFMKSSKGQSQISFISFGSAQPQLTKKGVEDLEVILPIKRDEQVQLGHYFSNLDHLITLHQRKCEETKKLKKFMLQKMFPKKGEKNPEIRFDGFTNDWEQRKVSELCSISTGKSNTQDKSEDGEYPFYVRSPIIERSTKYLYDEEAVITVGDGVGTGKVFHYVNGKYDLHQRCYRMYGFSDELNAHYFYHTFSKLFYKRVMAMTAKTSVDSVRLEMIADMEIPTPTIEEQIKIGTYFDHLDHLITLHQRKSEELKNVKKYMLQNMFAKGE